MPPQGRLGASSAPLSGFFSPPALRFRSDAKAQGPRQLGKAPLDREGHQFVEQTLKGVLSICPSEALLDESNLWVVDKHRVYHQFQFTPLPGSWQMNGDGDMMI